jgi:hypothetical protein
MFRIRSWIIFIVAVSGCAVFLALAGSAITPYFDAGAYWSTVGIVALGVLVLVALGRLIVALVDMIPWHPLRSAVNAVICFSSFAIAFPLAASAITSRFDVGLYWHVIGILVATILVCLAVGTALVLTFAHLAWRASKSRSSEH